MKKRKRKSVNSVKRLVKKINKVTLGPDDVLVVTVDMENTAFSAEEIEDAFARIFNKDNHIILIPKSITIDVVENKCREIQNLYTDMLSEIKSETKEEKTNNNKKKKFLGLF